MGESRDRVRRRDGLAAHHAGTFGHVDLAQICEPGSPAVAAVDIKVEAELVGDALFHDRAGARRTETIAGKGHEVDAEVYESTASRRTKRVGDGSREANRGAEPGAARAEDFASRWRCDAGRGWAGTFGVLRAGWSIGGVRNGDRAGARPLCSLGHRRGTGPRLVTAGRRRHHYHHQDSKSTACCTTRTAHC